MPMETLMILAVLFVLPNTFDICECKYALTSEHCAITNFQTNIDANETEIEIRYCPLDGVPAGALDHLYALEEFLMLHMPTLHAFPNVTAVGTTLQILSLWSNKISYINPDFLNALVVLELLNIASNNVLHCIPDVPSLQSLQQLYIKDNSFRTFPRLTHGQALQILSLSDNPIAAIAQDDLQHVTAIKWLLIDGSDLKELPDFVHLSQMKYLHLGGPSLELMPAHHTPVLGDIYELDLQDAVQLEFVPTLCTRHPHILTLELSGSGVRLCHCHHAWLKAAADAGATVITAAVCGGHDWHSLTTAQFLGLCEQRNPHRSATATVTRRGSPLFCAFPRQSVQNNTSLSDCILECMNTKGCLSVNFRPTVSEDVGECVLLAPSADGGYVEATDEEECWMLYGLALSDM